MPTAQWRVPRCLADNGFVDADPDPLMRWALAATETGDRTVGVVVAADGHLVAYTRRLDTPEEIWGVALHGTDTVIPLRWSMTGLHAVTGQPIIHVPYWQVCR